MKMNEEMIFSTLDAISAREFPQGYNLLHQPGKKAKSIFGSSRRVIALGLITLLALILMAFVLYRLFSDPGLGAAHDAGLGSTAKQTAQSTLLPATATLPYAQKSPAVLNLAQTQQGVTLTLEWISLSRTRLIAGFRIENLPDGQTIGMPTVDFSDISVQQYRGRLLQFFDSPVQTAEFTSNQVIGVDENSAPVNLRMEVPLEDLSGQTLGTFAFDLKGIPADSDSPASGQFTYSARVDQQEVRLEWLKIGLAGSSALICYDNGSTSPVLSPENVLFQVNQPEGKISPVQTGTDLKGVSTPEGQSCAVVSAPITLNTGDLQMLVGLNHLGAQEGTWQMAAQPSERGPFSEPLRNSPTPQPTMSSQKLGELTANLIWAYADANRVAMEVHFDGWNVNYSVGEFTVKDASGNEINSSYGSTTVGNDAATQLMTIYLDQTGQPTQASQVDLGVDVPVYDLNQSEQPLASFHFDLHLPVYPAQNIKADQKITANGIEMQLIDLSLTPTYTQVTLCYQKPPSIGTNFDWWMGQGVVLQIGSNTATLDGGRLLSDSDLGGYAGKGTPPADLPTISDGRCVQLGFPIGDLDSSEPQSLELTIPKLEISMPEVVPQEEIDAANEKLSEKGMHVQYQTFSASGGGGGGFVFTQKPVGMNDQQAYETLLEALGYEYPGPWKFSVTIPGR